MSIKTKPTRINAGIVDEVDSFKYLGSLVTKTGGADEDVIGRIINANTVFIQLYPIWRGQEIAEKTKLGIFNSNIKSLLMYGCETWKVTQSVSSELQLFLNKCLRKIINIYWPNVVYNDVLRRMTY